MANHVHYISGSGMHGCLYDNGPHVHATYQEAVDSLAFTFELGRDRTRQLKRDGYLELNNRRDGAEYCQISSCECMTPWEHDEQGQPEDWPDYVAADNA